MNNISEKEDTIKTDKVVKSRQMVKMLTFRVIPEYYKEIEKVAKNKKTTVSKLIRTYIKEGLKRDKEMDHGDEDKYKRISNMF